MFCFMFVPEPLLRAGTASFHFRAALVPAEYGIAVVGISLSEGCQSVTVSRLFSSSAI